MELSMRGIEYSLLSSPAFPVQEIDREQLTNILQGVLSQLQRKLEQARCPLPMTAPETIGEFMGRLSLQLEPIFPIKKYEWTLFFFSCIDILLDDTIYTRVSPCKLQTQFEKKEFSIIRTFKTWILKLTSRKRLEFAFKCSISLGMVVLFGLIFDKGNGRWAGLTIAISFVTGRHAVFTIANTRAQGTAIGSIYGVICCFLFQSEEARLLAVLPWIIFTSFLRHSRMYSQTGGISAAIGALLILGRKNYGDPDEFAMARLTMDCIKQTEFYNSQTNLEITKFPKLREKQRNVETFVCELKVFVADANLEPDFWYMPFRTSCYQKLIGSFTNVVNMLHFIIYNLEILSKLEESYTIRKESQEQTTSELVLSMETLSALLKYMEEVNLIKSPADCKELIVEKFKDLEGGKLQNPEKRNASMTTDEVADKITEENDSDDKKQLRERMIRCAGAMRFCISSLRKEIDDIEICIKEITQRENHSRQ
ncbi:hypothetical protein BUALT_Bualt09G0109900 [Buddleja alternifolia]|uniref:Integral membrane bound transporter domain-containing protein n=1 Tax=Buddleja alternifolia TaxID=168488 RepID=A0AAV6X320_9LAMI|nr:hypothetical protein BUALT_Bualt09G0109900 [Buddleja alternifolia]